MLKDQTGRTLQGHCWHFKNAASAARCRRLYGDDVDDMAMRIRKIKTGEWNPNEFDMKFIKLANMLRLPIKGGSR